MIVVTIGNIVYLMKWDFVGLIYAENISVKTALSCTACSTKVFRVDRIIRVFSRQ